MTFEIMSVNQPETINISKMFPSQFVKPISSIVLITHYSNQFRPTLCQQNDAELDHAVAKPNKTDYFLLTDSSSMLLMLVSTSLVRLCWSSYPSCVVWCSIYCVYQLLLHTSTAQQLAGGAHKLQLGYARGMEGNNRLYCTLKQDVRFSSVISSVKASVENVVVEPP